MNKNNAEINKKLHGYIRPGECYHKWSKINLCKPIKFCKNKGCWAVEGIHNNPDYSTKEGFWDVYNYVYLSGKFDYTGFLEYISGISAIKVFHYNNLARHVFEFLGGREK